MRDNAQRDGKRRRRPLRRLINSGAYRQRLSGTLELVGYIRDAADAPADLCFSDDVNVTGEVNVTIA